MKAHEEHSVVLIRMGSSRNSYSDTLGTGTRSAGSLPVKRLSEILLLDIKVENGSLAVSEGIVTSTVLLQEGVETILSRVFVTAHKHH